MELLQLLYFCSAAETENFSETARKYGIPPTGVSQSIRRLEKELGVELFDRNAKVLKLNRRGKDFYLHAKSSLAMLEDGKRKACEEEISGRINLLVKVNRFLVEKTIEDFKDKYEDVSFCVHYEQKADFDKYDLIITDSFPAYKESYERRNLINDDIVIAMNNEHPLCQKSGICVSDLKNERFISYTENNGLYDITRLACGREKFFPNFVILIDDPVSIIRYVEQGRGIAMIPKIAFGGLFTDKICLKPMNNIKRNTFVCYNKSKYMSKATMYFLDMLYEMVENY